jgi:hypothetical protein
VVDQDINKKQRRSWCAQQEARTVELQIKIRRYILRTECNCRPGKTQADYF